MFGKEDIVLYSGDREWPDAILLCWNYAIYENYLPGLDFCTVIVSSLDYRIYCHELKSWIEEGFCGKKRPPTKVVSGLPAPTTSSAHIVFQMIYLFITGILSRRQVVARLAQNTTMVVVGIDAIG